jgi:hypothetical protein
MPDYMHTKILLALQHAISGSLLINGVEWTIEEEYELIESQSQYYPFQAASIWLTRKNYYLTNTI